MYRFVILVSMKDLSDITNAFAFRDQRGFASFVKKSGKVGET